MNEAHENTESSHNDVAQQAAQCLPDDHASIPVMILGESGTGKSASMRLLSPENTLLIQILNKPMPFKSNHWKEKDSNGKWAKMVTDNPAQIINAIQKTRKKTIIIDDFQYLMANQFMRSAHVKGYDKFTQIGCDAWHIIMAATHAGHGKVIYFLSHTDTDDQGIARAKTIGKLLDDKIGLEGMFTAVLQTHVDQSAQSAKEKFRFITQNNGKNTAKSPMGLFEYDMIENDLNFVTKSIINYYA